LYKNLYSVKIHIMLKIRLSKFGKRNAPTYRIVVSEARSKRDGKYLDILGFYNPKDAANNFSYDNNKYTQWLKRGAKPTEAVFNMVQGKYIFKKYEPKKAEKKGREPAENENNS